LSFETDHYAPHQGISKVHIADVSGRMPILPHLLPIFSPGGGEIWSAKGQRPWN
jgi:hypothetical protein